MALQPNEPIPVTLQAQEWQTVMAVLTEGPYRIVAPLLGSIQSQCLAHDLQSGALTPAKPGDVVDLTTQRRSAEP